MKRLTITAIAAAIALVPAGEAVAKSPVKDSVRSGVKQCRTERGAAGVEQFRQTYANKQGKRAFARCVVKQGKLRRVERRSALRTARKSCRAERTADPAAFREKYANKRGRHAALRCVVKTARTVRSDRRSAVRTALKACRDERRADVDAFKQKYANKHGRRAFARCVVKATRAELGGGQDSQSDDAAQTGSDS